MTCNCGVAIREHNDVIVLDTCTQDLVMRNGMPMKIRIPSGRKLRKGTYILGRHPGGYSEYEVSTWSQVHQMHNFIKHYMKVFPLSNENFIFLFTMTLKGLHRGYINLFPVLFHINQFLHVGYDYSALKAWTTLITCNDRLPWKIRASNVRMRRVVRIW